MKRLPEGSTIYKRNCLIGNGLIQNIFLSLKKGREVVIGGTRPKTLSIQRKPDFKFVSIDVKPSAGFKRKANPTEGGKCKNCHLLLEYG